MDIITGEGLEEALAGVDTVVDTATGPSPDKEAATQFFVTAARNLHEAGERAHLDGPIPVVADFPGVVFLGMSISMAA